MKNNSDTENVIIVSGAVLTREAIEAIVEWQKNDNAKLNAQREEIADAVCYIAQNLTELNFEREAAEVMEALGYIRECMKALMKP
jgi:NTP pyrophosphatase (non-canonical NTP hydrolase)